MITQFNIEPHRGALPIVFGMSREEVIGLLGSPRSSFLIWDGSGTSDDYSGFNIGYDTAGTVNHIGFAPGRIELCIQDRMIWNAATQPDPNPLLLVLDPNPFEYVGFWFYLQIGVTTTGYHDKDSAQYAVTVFPQNQKAALLTDAKPADTRQYTE